MSVTIQEQSQKMEELCEEIEVLIDMSFNLPTLVFLQSEHVIRHLLYVNILH
jgi:hypothetical protein